jgi:hypothetical protein
MLGAAPAAAPRDPVIPKQTPEERARTLVAEFKQDIAVAAFKQDIASAIVEPLSNTPVRCLGLLRTKEAMDELKAMSESGSKSKTTAKEVLKWLEETE